MSAATPPIVLIDGSSYFFRAFHALPPLANSKSQPTGAIYGVANMVKRLIKDYQPHHIAIVFDAKGKTFRHSWFPLYKAHRPPMPEALSSQFQPLLVLLTAMGLPVLSIADVEADDVIGTLARQATELALPVIISTSDKDMAQLVNEQVTLVNTMSNQHLDAAGVQAKFGVTPAQMIDYLALIGDTSDNIPGVPNCGPKTAAKWLATYHSIENLLTHVDEIGGKIGACLRANLPQLALAQRLVTIKTDVAMPFMINDLILRPADSQQLIAQIQDLEFKSWLSELLTDEKKASLTRDSSMNFALITELDQLERWIKQLQTCTVFCIDTETTDLNAVCAEIVGISFAIDPDCPTYIPLTHTDGTPQLSRQLVLDRLQPILENPKIGKIGQNLKYDYIVFKNHGITVQGIQYDTMLESYVLNSTAVRHNMDSLALKYLGYKTIQFEEVAGKGTKQLRFDQVPVHQAAAYAAEDADITLKLHHHLYPMLDETMRVILHDIEIPLLTVIAEIERHGVLIDSITLAQHGERLKKRIVVLQEEAWQLTGKPFNLSSPKQLQTILFDELQLPIVAKTPTGQPSTGEAVLQELAYDYRLPALILEHRSLSKLVSTYIDALPKQINPHTQRVHTSYNQAITATGRLSSSGPNLQNIPIRSEEGRLIRRAFIAPPEHVLLAADYSQIELRIMAHLSQDANFLHAFAQGWDIHAATASEIFMVDLALVNQEQRRRAKAVNFGLIYGMSAFGLAKQLSVSRQEAQEYITRYFQRYPGVFAYMENTRVQAREQGYVETVFGRRLYLPEINTRNNMRQKAAERAAINAPMQGTAADIIKKAMLAIAKWQTQSDSIPLRMIMQVHDELVFEVPKAEVAVAQPAIVQLMETAVTLSVPLLVTTGIGKNWDEAH